MAFTRNAGVFLLKGMKQTPKINGNMFQFENKQQGRDMVTLQEVKARIKSVGNIKKITATMKLVATSKLKNAENRMNKEARPFLEAVQGLPEIKEVTEQVKKTAGQEDKPAEHHKIIPITSDRGLCGSVNNSVIRLARTLLRDDKSEKISMSLIGSKGKAGLQREFSELIDFAAFDMGDKKGIRYSDVSPIAEAVAISDADKVSLVSNTYESLLSFNTEIIPVATPSQLASANLDKYEFESGDKTDTMRNFYEWYIGALLYARAIENAATEMSARMTSMDNATRNAGDMIKKLEIQYNRGRQAAITTELTEIISGAEAVAAPED